ADVFDAITSIRHYRDRMPIQDAIKIIREGAGNHFDNRIVDLFLSVNCDKIIDVILSDSNVILDAYSRKILEQHNLYQLESMINKENYNSEEKLFIDLFNNFYINNTGNTNENDNDN
ncbi:hypothetical protein IJG14_03715, partial [bacterium]|nr:hypothetical protein [bacterium]